jgi:hypothetical protein
MVTATIFVPGRKDEPLKPGLVLEVAQTSPSVLLRITHVFSHAIYVMPVFTANMARYAVRPFQQLRSLVVQRLETGIWRIGRLRLPQEFLDNTPPTGSEKDLIIGAFSAIEPLVEQFEDQRNLVRTKFNLLINRRAEELDISPVSVRRMLLRYYYFGRLKNALLPLRPGRLIGPQRPTSTDSAAGTGEERQQPKRRGRQPIESKDLGPNTFVVTEEDVTDMIECFETLATNGKITQVAAHEEYLLSYFSERHPKQYTDYLEKKCPLPVTLRQFRAITNRNAVLSRDVMKNVARKSERNTTDLLRNRTQWLNAQASNPAAGVKALRIVVGAAYTWLYRHDRDWLRANTAAKLHNIAQRRDSRVDWPQRDRTLANAVTAEVARIHFSKTNVRISATRLLRATGMDASSRRNMERLPMLKLAIAKHAEDDEAFYKRRRALAQAELVKKGYAEPAEWRIQHVSGIRKRI